MQPEHVFSAVSSRCFADSTILKKVFDPGNLLNPEKMFSDW
jgi:hypothetical protein